MNQQVHSYRNKSKQYQNLSLQQKYKTDISQQIYDPREQAQPTISRYQFRKPNTPQLLHEVFPNNRECPNQIQCFSEYNERKTNLTRYNTSQNLTRDTFNGNKPNDTLTLEDSYKKINSLLENENKNLKQQNEQLANRCNQLYSKKQKYKNLYENSKEALKAAFLEKQIYKEKASQLTQIIQHQMKKFYLKLNQKSQSIQQSLSSNQQIINVFPQKYSRYSENSENYLEINVFASNPLPSQQSYEQNLPKSSPQIQVKQTPRNLSSIYQQTQFQNHSCLPNIYFSQKQDKKIIKQGRLQKNLSQAKILICISIYFKFSGKTIKSSLSATLKISMHFKSPNNAKKISTSPKPQYNNYTFISHFTFYDK